MTKYDEKWRNMTKIDRKCRKCRKMTKNHENDEIWRKTSKNDENDDKSRKITKNHETWQKSRNITKNDEKWRNMTKIDGNCRKMSKMSGKWRKMTKSPFFDSCAHKNTVRATLDYVNETLLSSTTLYWTPKSVISAPRHAYLNRYFSAKLFLYNTISSLVNVCECPNFYQTCIILRSNTY